MQYPDYKLKLPGSLDEAVAAAAATNPALLSAKADVDAATAQFEASKSPFWPRITLEAEHNFSDNAEGISGDEYSTLVALRMHYNLYRGGADKARKLQTAVLLNEALEIHADKQRKITQEMGYVWNAVQAVQRQMPYLEQHVESAAATRKAYYEQFNIGRRTLLDLLNTENELVDARRSLIKARFDLALSEMQLLALCGNLRPALGLKAAVEKAKP
jgi:adhesin transport system outer membrane protein